MGIGMSLGGRHGAGRVALVVAVLLVLALGGVLLGACAAPSPSPPLRHVDLTHTLTQDMPHLPNTTATHIERTPDGSPHTLTLAVGNGTTLHLLAAPDPVTGAVDQGWTVERLSPRDLTLPAVVLDLRERAQDSPAYPITAADVQAWERQHGQLPSDALVLFLTGWDVRWGDPSAYLNLAPEQQLGVPHLHPATLDLLRVRGVRGIGIDTPQISRELPRAAPKGWLLLTNLTRLEQLPATGTTVWIGVLKLQGSHASPAVVRAVGPE